jgi:2-keto-4-pentenoate hydratase/2-oxohepta-3-ene-1,7-dioic acid hydratase in catechol pathway
MKIVRFIYDDNIYWGSLDADTGIISTFFEATVNLTSFGQVIDIFTDEQLDLTDQVNLADVTLLAPVLPSKNILCIGKNYYDHILEFDGSDSDVANVKDNPIFFSKAISSITDPDADILLHPGVTDEVDYEVELAVIIGKPGINIDNANALEHIFGYTILNDVTCRDLQRIHQQWMKGKSLDTHCPIGPWLITADEIADPQDLAITSKINGEVRQDSNTKLMIHNVASLIEVLSKGMSLNPGDVIASGTPVGVGMGFDPPKFLRSGDKVEMTIEKIGTLKNTVI